MSWLEEHIESFVMPIVKNHEAIQEPLSYFEQEELTIIKNAWRSIKKDARGRTILLPGRDVFIFEVLARREGYPTTFIPECSRMTVAELAKTLDVSNCYLFDTGFAGSIPRALRMENFKLLSHHEHDSRKQIFPRLTMSRHLALKIEGTPKYWESGRLSIMGIQDNEVVQPLSKIHEFIEAARLTIAIYKNSAPKFINKSRPLYKEVYPKWSM